MPPFAEPEFIQRSILPSEGGEAQLWLLYTTLAWGTDKARFICLWNGGGGDGPGGTEHMYKEVKEQTGQVTWLDTRKLWTM
jgi:hypothetical protein